MSVSPVAPLARQAGRGVGAARRRPPRRRRVPPTPRAPRRGVSGALATLPPSPRGPRWGVRPGPPPRASPRLRPSRGGGARTPPRHRVDDVATADGGCQLLDGGHGRPFAQPLLLSRAAGEWGGGGGGGGGGAAPKGDARSGADAPGTPGRAADRVWGRAVPRAAVVGTDGGASVRALRFPAAAIGAVEWAPLPPPPHRGLCGGARRGGRQPHCRRGCRGRRGGAAAAAADARRRRAVAAERR
ncbi:hypothetical protein BU14_0027s0012 [Porphyra umbilicalis]|uniref:Uncharacterized protein n=1 Tax=Porphyra umbilicalis TaxID=2786 RepID=A0A1X6PJP2_PORUM|nr:hypothetical protein BU14_0027s0012 [Porphyra umbilicalis]|eukprot:OSX80986.1 hypothetical protein BU14_0027s0012 [Porphyra umbilicalis]